MLSSKRAKIRVPNRLGFPNETFETLWTTLEDAIDSIYDDKVSQLYFENLYRIVYTLVLRRNGSEVYKGLENYLAKKLDVIREEEFGSELQGFEFLSKLLGVWENQCNCFKLVSDVMIYMDKVYCKQERKLQTYDLGLQLFKKHIIVPLSSSIDQAMIQNINNLRSQRSLESNHVGIWRGIAGLMETLEDEKDNYFQNHFEPVLLLETENYYHSELEGHTLPPVEFLDLITELKCFELELDTKLLSSDSTAKITSVLEKVLLWNQKFIDIVPDLVRRAINENNATLLKDLSALSPNDNFGDNILICIKKCILDDASSLPIDTNSRKRAQVATSWTKSVIALFDKYKYFLKDLEIRPNARSQEDPDRFHFSSKLLSDVFSEYLNQKGKQTIELITLYLDSCLKLTQRKCDVERIKSDLEASVKLFNLVADKDIFINIYKQQLSKRLLQHKSMIELERWMVKNIKDEMGTFYTSKLDGMLRDMTTSTDLLSSFSNSLTDGQLREFTFTPQILTMTSWPFQPHSASDDNIQLPLKLERLKLEFEVYYSKKYPERTLQWAHTLGFIEIGFQFDSSYHELSMPMYAGIIFLLFERYDELTFEMIEEQTNIPEHELRRQLMSLVMAPRSRILRKKPPTKFISPNDKFFINYSYSSPTRKVKVQTVAGLPQSSKADSYVDVTQDSVKRERSSEVNAAIVRIMKEFKLLSHDELMQKATDTLEERFPLTGPTFKKSVNYLLEKEYIQRDPGDLSVYHYIS